MLQTEARPTGRRRITPAMIAAQAALPSYWEGTRKGTVLAALKRAADALGIARRVIDLIDALMSFTRPADWARGCGAIACWPSNAVLQDALQIGPSQLKTLFRLAAEAGLLEIHDSPTGKRYGHRDAEGCVTRFYGFDLSPLARRLSDFQRIAADRKAAWQQGQQLRADVTACRKAIEALADAAREQGAPGDWQAVAIEAQQLAQQRGSSRDPAHLAPIVAALEELRGDALATLTALQTVKSDPEGPENRPLITTTTQLSIAKANTDDDGPSRPGALHQSRQDETVQIKANENTKSQPKQGQRERRDEGVTRGFDVSPSFVVQIAPAFARWITVERPTWAQLVDASSYVRSELGVSQHAWGQACNALGRFEAVVLLATIAARHEAGEVGSPGGMMRRMVELHQDGALRLDKTLFGLADRLKGRAH